MVAQLAEWPVKVHLPGRGILGEGQVMEECGSILENLKRFFQIDPKFARYFNVHPDANNQIDEQDISRVAQDRVIVKICLRTN